MDINRIPKEELGKGSNIKLNVCDTEVDMYWKVAIEVLETIEEKAFYGCRELERVIFKSENVIYGKQLFWLALPLSTIISLTSPSSSMRRRLPFSVLSLQEVFV